MIRAGKAIRTSGARGLARGVVVFACTAGALAVFAQSMPAPAKAVSKASTSAASVAPVRFLVVASRESVLSASTAGRIARVPVGLGDSVRAGEVVASFDCAEIVARREAARAEHESARVQYEAKMKLQGLQSAAEVEVELAAAIVNKARSQIRIFDAQLVQCSFVASFAGKVARVHVKVGQGINPGAPVIELVGSGPPKARMNVPSSWLAWLKPGETLNGTVDETGGAATLKVTRIAGRVDAVSQTVEIETELVSAAGQVLPGMSGQVRVPARGG
jgi:membrane fusion protein (multidrug efflux system)